MLEYAFFDASLMQRFVDRAAQHGVACRVGDDPVAGTIVAIPDDLADAVLDALDEFYESLQLEQAVLAEEEEGWVTKRLAGVQVTLADGSVQTVRLDAATANRLLGAFTPAEAQALVQAIVDSLEDPRQGPLCKMPIP